MIEVFTQKTNKIFNKTSKNREKKSWHTYFSTAVGLMIQQPMVRFFNSHCQHFLAAACTIVQLSLARLFNSRWYNSLAVTGRIVPLLSARLFNSRWHDCSTVKLIILFCFLAQFFNSDSHFWRIVQCTRKATYVIYCAVWY